MKKIKIIHLRSLIDSEREKKSAKSILSFSNEFEVDYKEYVNKPFEGIVPYENFARKNNSKILEKTNKGHYGCFLAHRQAVLENTTNQAYDGLLIFECDAYFAIGNKEFKIKLENAIDFCEKNDVDLFTFGPTYYDKHTEIVGDFCFSKLFLSAHAYYIPRNKFAKFQEIFSDKEWDYVDVFYSSKLKKIASYKFPYVLYYTGESLIHDTDRDGVFLFWGEKPEHLKFL